MLAGPPAVNSARKVFAAGTRSSTPANRSGRSVIERPMVMPPADPPRMNSLAGRRDPACDQVFAAGDQIAPGVMFVRILAAEPPLLAELAAPAHVAHAVRDALAHRLRAANTEIGKLGNAVRAIRLDDRDLWALDALWLNQGQRYLRAVSGLGVQIADHIVGRDDVPARARL